MSQASFAFRRSSIAMPFMAVKGTTNAIWTLTSTKAQPSASSKRRIRWTVFLQSPHDPAQSRGDPEVGTKEFVSIVRTDPFSA